MPFVIKTTMNFSGAEQGWSETFYWNQGSSNLKNAEATILPIAQKRAKCLADGYTLTVFRNSVVLNETNVKLKRVTDVAEPRLPGQTKYAPATPNLALLLTWQNPDQTKKKAMYMRGIPAGLGDAGKAPDVAYKDWYGQFQAWRTAMIGLSAGWLVTTATDPNTAVIESYTTNETTGIVTFTLKAPGITFPGGQGFKQRVWVSLPGKSPLDGYIVIIPGSGLTCTTAEPIGVHPFEPGQFGIMQLRTSTLVTLASVGDQANIGTIDPQRIITHKTGRPSYASRGRAPVKPKW